MLQILPPHYETRRIGAAEIMPLSKARAVALFKRLIRMGGHAKVAFANAHFLNVAAADAEFSAVLNQFTILPDGLGVDLASQLLYGKCFTANLNGTDFIPFFLAAHGARLRIGLIGARPGIADKAAAYLCALTPQHEITAISHGYFSPEEETALLERLASAPPDVLLVAMGNPAQEKWIARHITPAHARVVMGVGAFFDFVSQTVVRAPPRLRALRLEWVWRLVHEPRRLWRRYILGNPAFLLRVLRQKYFEPRGH
jgi:exopolysaccharide biosynthesis WecB/TagA/CpsF family protein